MYRRIYQTLCLIAFLAFGCNPKNETVDDNAAIVLETEEDWSQDDQEPEETETVGELEQSLIDAGLVDVKDIIPGVFVDLKYSSSDNFFGQDVYGDLYNCYLQTEVAEMLKKAYEHLQKYHPELTFLIYDGVRPLRVQQILWDNLDKPDSIKPLYVADPKIGGLHNYGVAVDLTLAWADSGEALDLGTAYDYFGYPAYPDREDQMLKEGKITQAHIDNRKILREAMKAGGFTGIGSEWWHFNAFSRKKAAELYGLVH
ncbi:M15 family metallopeptidase [Cecembia sp.]|uniref:M15 family metallopeptidase n=1 Tax=Cecembia sp. TaxID=1898110 RepID=UPI0025C64AA9|nr:M15 family metallopeptidase [Cecembia sp.]